MLSSTTPDQTNPEISPEAVLRLTALWAVVESGLGGVLHAFKLPLTGLMVGGMAVVLITLIAHFAKDPRAILRATLTVLIVKALVSPHSPIGAYVAVSFQGLMGFAIYSLSRPGYLSSIPFAVTAMLESALQKLLMLVLFFGQPLVEAVDGWGAWVVQRYFTNWADASWSLTWTLVALYVGVYALGGMFIGWFAAGAPAAIESARRDFAHAQGSPQLDSAGGASPPIQSRRGRKSRRLAVLVAISLALGLSVYFSAQDDDSRLISASLYMVRTLSIVALWYVVVAPWLAQIFRGWLLARRGRVSDQLDAVLALVPRIRSLAKTEYNRLRASASDSELPRWRRATRWLTSVIALSLTMDYGEAAHSTSP